MLTFFPTPFASASFRRVRTTLLCLIFLLAGSSGADAQTGRVTGAVKATESGAGLPGVTVYLAETMNGNATALDGTFEITRVRPGTYTLVASLVGYGTHRETITVAAGATTEIAVTLAEQAVDLDEVIAQAERPYSAASSSALRQFDLKVRPAQSSQDLLQLTPGLVTAQHAGGGKAEQIFLRGFDADHGTDVRIVVDGMPVNMVSHGHGQGYADLHFLLPGVVERVDVQKGPYAAEHGDLATAGAVAFTTKDHLEHNEVQAEYGAFNTASLSTLYQIPLPGTAHQGAYLAGKFYQTDGPVQAEQDVHRFNLFGKFHTHLSQHARLAVSASGFSSAWDASGQIPARAVSDGRIGRFGSLDPLEGGTTGRQDVNVAYNATAGRSAFQLRGFASRYTFKLFSNFTYFLEDPVDGDMIEQTDRRTLYGMEGRYRFAHDFGETLGTFTLGGGFRGDDADVALWKSPDRIRTAALVDAAVAQRNLFLWSRSDLVFSRAVRLQLGLRTDYFTFDVNDHREGDPTATLPHASGYGQQAIISPKASLVVSPTPRLDLFLNAGSGFHSNDARAVVLGTRVADLTDALRRDGLTDDEIAERLAARNYDRTQIGERTLPRALGAEVGVRQTWGSRLTAAAAAWWLDLDREFVFVGDGGFTELSGHSRRYGLDVEARLRLTAWLWADADLNLSRGFFPDEPDDANAIPLAPTVTSTGGLTARLPSGLEGSLRYVHIGDRPANETGQVTAEGYTLVNLFAAYRLGDLRFSLTAENLLDVAWNEAQFDTESRLRGEAAPVSELHFTPGNPRNIRLGVAYLF